MAKGKSKPTTIWLPGHMKERLPEVAELLLQEGHPAVMDVERNVNFSGLMKTLLMREIKRVDALKMQNVSTYGMGDGESGLAGE
jgi:hypothetical protein